MKNISEFLGPSSYAPKKVYQPACFAKRKVWTTAFCSFQRVNREHCLWPLLWIVWFTTSAKQILSLWQESENCLHTGSGYKIFHLYLFYYFPGMFLWSHVINAIRHKFTVPSSGRLGRQFCKDDTCYFRGLKSETVRNQCPHTWNSSSKSLKINKCTCADQLHS